MILLSFKPYIPVDICDESYSGHGYLCISRDVTVKSYPAVYSGDDNTDSPLATFTLSLPQLVSSDRGHRLPRGSRWWTLVAEATTRTGGSGLGKSSDQFRAGHAPCTKRLVASALSSTPRNQSTARSNSPPLPVLVCSGLNVLKPR